ncbi:uncharacterized protein C19orf47 homolog isoform X2 [Protopterus annectens]|uniref:uncharacterized protein C19orf47 homolog isoform X2 n=1 Tax=Protopterus annectens TaxID=7888 RepID=UPI001CFAE876|nr:uncharacterized protein C19orf47 homolog isoform X2 [Protopterus annectens]XP_043937420.1 uncharacterized protein C19orf47 homolog isoform X2 [Protopterus annectens]
MASVTLATSEWIQFFKEAGIPPGFAVNYAITFVDNRIQKSMLMDLNKEILHELGIDVVGDAIAILKHAKVAYKQDLSKLATEQYLPGQKNTLQTAQHRTANTPAARMITSSLSRDLPSFTPSRRPDTGTSKISVTVSNKMATKNAETAVLKPAINNPDVPVKRRRITAEIEGYVISMPKGVAAKKRKILEQQPTTALQRTSVFERLGAEKKVDTITGNKPTGVFSRLGEELEEGGKIVDSDDDGSVLQYAGVLKKTSTAFSKKPPASMKTSKHSSSEDKPVVTAISHLPRLPNSNKSTIASEVKTRTTLNASAKRKQDKPTETRDSEVISTKSVPSFRITFSRTLGNAKVRSTSEMCGAQMDSTKNISVFERLGRKKLQNVSLSSDKKCTSK